MHTITIMPDMILQLHIVTIEPVSKNNFVIRTENISPVSSGPLKN